MDIIILLKFISGILTFLLLFFSWRLTIDKKAKVLFSLMLLFFLLSVILFFPEGYISDWLKHIPFFIGQLLFCIFLWHCINHFMIDKDQSPAQGSVAQYVAGLGAGSYKIVEDTSSDWFGFITQQGVQHIIALPFLFLIISLIRVQYNFISSHQNKSILNMFLAAGVCLTIIHIGEFVVESQNWIPALEGETIEIIEFMWYYSALFLFFFALKRLNTSLGNRNVT